MTIYTTYPDLTDPYYLEVIEPEMAQERAEFVYLLTEPEDEPDYDGMNDDRRLRDEGWF